MTQIENELIDECAAIAERYALEERAESKRFGQLAKKDDDNSQYKIAQATHAIISVVCSRIAEDIRKLK